MLVIIVTFLHFWRFSKYKKRDNLRYARLQFFIQLSQTLTKLCHIKRDYLVHVICPNVHHRPKRTRSDVCESRW